MNPASGVDENHRKIQPHVSAADQPFRMDRRASDRDSGVRVREKTVWMFG
jgi:hypothetical protein